jgi:hypothetical protein
VVMFHTASKPILGPIRHPVQLVSRCITAGVKQPEREANYSLPSNTEVKNEWSYTSIHLRPHIVVLG